MGSLKSEINTECFGNPHKIEEEVNILFKLQLQFVFKELFFYFI